MQSFLLIGFLLCKHESMESQAVDFWHLVNPKLDEFVPRDKVIDILFQMCYIAVDLPIKYLNVRIRGFQLKDLGAKTELGPNELKGQWIPRNKNGSLAMIPEDARNMKEQENAMNIDEVQSLKSHSVAPPRGQVPIQTLNNPYHEQ